jgi:hypothetical protein
MSTFRGLLGEQAKTEFALVVLHSMPNGNINELDEIFDEACEAGVLEPDILDQLQNEAISILPVKFMYEEGEEAEMKKFQDYRDKILSFCT